MAGTRRGTFVPAGGRTGAILSRRLRNRRMHALNGNVDNGSKQPKVIEPITTAGDGATTNSTASGATTGRHAMRLRPRDGEVRAQPKQRQGAAQAACERRAQRSHHGTQQRRRAAEGAARHREPMHIDELSDDGTEPQVLCQRAKPIRPRDDPQPVHHDPDSTSQGSSASARETRAKLARRGRDSQPSQSEELPDAGGANAAAARAFLRDDSLLSVCQPCGAPASEADTSTSAAVLAPVPVPHGYVLAAPPLEATLRLESPDLPSLVGLRIIYRWQGGFGWCVGSITQAPLSKRCRPELDCGRVPLVRVEWDGEKRHSDLAIPLSEYASARDDPYGSWALLQPADAGAIAASAPAASAAMPMQMQGSMLEERCPWPGCSGGCQRYGPHQLLQHIRHVHGGNVDDDLLARLGGTRCPTCSQPFVKLAPHYKLDPKDGVRKCPYCSRPPAPAARAHCPSRRHAT